MRAYTDEHIPADRRRTARPKPTDAEPDLFAPVLVTPTRTLMGMVRGNDPVTSQRAAVDVLPKRAWVKKEILRLLATEGPLTDGELESREIFMGLGPSTVRKRRGELVETGLVREVGTRCKMTLWDLKP